MNVLILRDAVWPTFWRHIEGRLRTEYKDLQLTIRNLLDPLPDLATFNLLVFWLFDPLDDRPDIAGRADAAARRAQAAGLPVFQHPAGLRSGRKSVFAERLAGWQGGRIARVSRDVRVPLPLPFFVREDAQHACDVVRFDTAADVEARFDETCERCRNPLLVEYIETGLGGVYSKFRYVVAGDRGCRLHVQTANTWYVHGAQRVTNGYTLGLERAYLWTERRIPELHDAAKMLGLDFCAFDYALDENDRIVLWEANPAPTIHFLANTTKIIDGQSFDLEYRNVATRRAIDALATAWRARALFQEDRT